MAKQKPTKIKMLVAEYGGICFLSGEVTKHNPLTFHHIVPIRHGGPHTIENGAPICLFEHGVFNVVEAQRPLAGKEITETFLDLKRDLDLKVLKDLRAYLEWLVTEDMGYEMVKHGHTHKLRRR